MRTWITETQTRQRRCFLVVNVVTRKPRERLTSVLRLYLPWSALVCNLLPTSACGSPQRRPVNAGGCGATDDIKMFSKHSCMWKSSAELLKLPPPQNLWMWDPPWDQCSFKAPQRVPICTQIENHSGKEDAPDKSGGRRPQGGGIPGRTGSFWVHWSSRRR